MKLNEGIKHIEDLEVQKFIDTIRNLNDYTFTEKVDGFNLKFGVDEQGFYTRGKTPDKKRDVEDYGLEFRYTGFKSAHSALASILPEILRKNLLEVGDEVEAEVLFGELPNTVPYNGEKNKIIFLRTTEGYADILRLKEELDGFETEVDVKMPYTTDGKTIQVDYKTHAWIFSATPRVSKLVVKNINKSEKLERTLRELENYLEQRSNVGDLTNLEVLALPLNKKPREFKNKNWKEVKEFLRYKKNEIHYNVKEFKLGIKEDLLNKLVRSVASEFGPDVTNGGWIEGIVLSRSGDSELIKIVDKDVFTALNEFNWHVRNKIGGNPKGVNNVDSISGKIRVALAKAVGHPELGTQQKNRYIQKNDLSIEKLASEIENFAKTKEKFLKILEKGEDVLSKYHKFYNRYKTRINKEIDFGEYKRKFELKGALDEKNLEAFAELYQLISTMRKRTEEAETKKELAELVIGDVRINEGVKLIVRESFKSIDFDVNFILENCSEWFKETGPDLQVLHRGIGKPKADIFIGKSRTDRLPKDSDLEMQEAIDKILMNLGIEAKRHNSIFTFPEAFGTATYGSTFVIIPMNGYKYSYHKHFGDLLEIDDLPYICHNYRFKDEITKILQEKDPALFDLRKEQDYRVLNKELSFARIEYYNEFLLSKSSPGFWEDIIQKWYVNDMQKYIGSGFSDKNIKEVVKDYKREILISGKYIAIKKDIWEENKHQLEQALKKQNTLESLRLEDIDEI